MIHQHQYSKVYIKRAPSHWTASTSCIKVGGVSPGSEFCDVIRSSSSSLRPAFDWHLHTHRERELRNTATRPDWRWWRKQQTRALIVYLRKPAVCVVAEWPEPLTWDSLTHLRRDGTERHTPTHETRHGFNERKTHEEPRDEEQKMNNTHTQLWHLMYYKRGHELINQNALDLFWHDIVQ